MTYLKTVFSEQVEDQTEVKLAEQGSSEKQQSTNRADRLVICSYVVAYDIHTDHALPANLLSSILYTSYATVCSLYQ